MYRCFSAFYKRNITFICNSFLSC